MRRILGILSLSLAGCLQLEPGEQVSYWIDDPDGRFSEAQKDSIREAFDWWSDSLGDEIFFREVQGKGSDVLIVIRPVPFSQLEKDKSVGETWVDPWSRGGGIELPYDALEGKLTKITGHEIGHALGCNHLSNGTLMATTIANVTSKVTCADVKEFCRANDCDAQEMPACQKVKYENE